MGRRKKLVRGKSHLLSGALGGGAQTLAHCFPWARGRDGGGVAGNPGSGPQRLAVQPQSWPPPSQGKAFPAGHSGHAMCARAREVFMSPTASETQWPPVCQRTALPGRRVASPGGPLMAAGPLHLHPQPETRGQKCPCPSARAAAGASDPRPLPPSSGSPCQLLSSGLPSTGGKPVARRAQQCRPNVFQFAFSVL